MLAAKQEEQHAKAWRALSKQQRELRAAIDGLAAHLAQREPTADDLEEVLASASASAHATRRVAARALMRPAVWPRFVARP